MAPSWLSVVCRRAPVRFVGGLVVAACAAVGTWLYASGSAGGGSVTLAAVGTAYTQDFNALVSSGTSSVLPSGWYLDETGSAAAANGQYTAGTGTGTAGDVYSFGAAGSSDRALGTLFSGTNTPTIGASFTNNTGQTINEIAISYTGEQWRLGATTGRPDRLDFQYSTNATNLLVATYTSVDALDFTAPYTGPTVGARDGTAAANRVAVSATISGLSIPNGAVFFLRWRDFDASPGADDGLAIDDFSLTPKSSTDPSATGSSSPTAVEPGESTLLTVTVTPGTTPTSTGLDVTSNLTAIGGSATQQFFDDGTNGDAVAGNLVFSYQASVSTTATAGAKVLPATVTDAQGRSVIANISLTVLPPQVPIHTVQGNGPTSSYAGQLVTVAGIVTQRRTNGFFIQTPDAAADADPNTSQALFVFTGGAPPATAAVGNAVKVGGTIVEFQPAPPQPSLTELTGPTLVVTSTGNTLPAPVTLAASDTYPATSPGQLERLEGMRVNIANLTVVAPTEGNVSEPNATSASDGVFFGVIAGVPRPFREAGIEPWTAVPPCAAGPPCAIPQFDGNFERLRVDSNEPGVAVINVDAGATVSNLVGVLIYDFGANTILPDPSAPPTVLSAIDAAPLPAPTAEQFTIASFNLERFFDTLNDPAIGEPILTAAAFANRLTKVSLAIRNVMRTPDIIGIVEVENLATLQAIAQRINDDAAASAPNYQAHLAEGNDVGGIDVGFLVKASRVNVVDVVQEGKDAQYTNPVNNTLELLNDRPPLVLRALIDAPVGMPFPVTVIVNHLRSLNDIDHPVAGPRVRAKRAAQAEFLANLVQTRQSAGERVALVGDFNAFEVNDGYADLIATIKGAPAPATQVAVASPDLVAPNLVNLVEVVPAEQRYSYVFGGTAQVLDHVLVTSNLAPRAGGLAFAHVDADYAEVRRNDTARPERISDHDAPVAYFFFPGLPTIQGLTATPGTIWPADHRMATVSLSYTVGSDEPVCAVESVTSNEADNGRGDGNTAQDIEIVDATTVRVRAERRGGGHSRIYTIALRCTDAYGSSSSATTQVIVPHDRRK